MPAPRIKLSPIKRSLPEPILPVLNSPSPAAAPVQTASVSPAWQGVPVPPRRGAPAPFDPPAPFEPPVPFHAPDASATPESAAGAASPTAGATSGAVAGEAVSPAVAELSATDPAVAAPGEGVAVPLVSVVARASSPAVAGSHAAAALSISRANGVGTLIPVGSPSGAASAGGAVPLVAVPAGAAPAAGPDGSGALLTGTGQAEKIRSGAVFIKWGAYGLLAIVAAFAVVRVVVPFLLELKNPSEKNVIADKDAPTAVRMLQQTRAVVAKNNANAAYLNEIAAGAEPKPVTPPAPAPVVAAVAAPVAPVIAQPVDNTRFIVAVDRMQVASVVSGDAARAMIDGRLIRKGDIVNRTLGLRFSGVDDESHTVLFTNADNVVFKKYY